MSTLRIVSGVAAACAAAAVLGSCVSERSTGAAAVAASTCALPIGTDVIGAGTTLVLINNYAFYPDTVRIKAGQKIAWVNCSSPNDDQHTTTSNTGIWDSPLLAAGDSFTEIFATTGTFAYHCTPHSFMTGAVVVE